MLHQHLFTIKSRDDKFMVLQAPNERKLNVWIDTLREYVFEFGSPLGLGRDLHSTYSRRSKSNVRGQGRQRADPSHSFHGTSTLMSNSNEIMVLGRGRMSAKKNRRRFFDYIQQNNIDAIRQMLDITPRNF